MPKLLLLSPCDFDIDMTHPKPEQNRTQHVQYTTNHLVDANFFKSSCHQKETKHEERVELGGKSSSAPSTNRNRNRGVWALSSPLNSKQNNRKEKNMKGAGYVCYAR